MAQAPVATVRPAGPSEQAAPPRTKVAANYSAVAGSHLVIYVADYAGIFAEHGLDVELSSFGAANAAQALVAGQIDFTTMSGQLVVYAAAGGAPVVAVAQDLEQVAMSIHGAPDIKSLAELRGKRLGVAGAGSLTELIARVALKETGLRVGDDVSLVNVPGMPELVPAMVGGGIDAAVISPPLTFLARDAGFPELVDVTTMGPSTRLVGTVLATRREYLAAQPDVARRFVEAYAAAVRRAREDPATAEAALMKRLQQDDRDLIEATYRIYARLLKDPPVPTPESWQALLDVMGDTPGINPAVRSLTPETLIDARYFNDSVAR
jgi:NitT/TauT family transport system substrate-binding protein